MDQVITKERLRQLRALEGRLVSVAFANGSRAEGCELVSIGRQGAGTVWLVVDSVDIFVRFDQITDMWAATKRLFWAA